MIRKYSKKGLEKRKEERKDFPTFFQHHIQVIKDNNLCCEECGERLKGDVSEIAHVLPKSFFKSISTNDINVLYLCCRYSSNDCHSKFDNSATEEVKQMKIYPKVQKIFRLLKEEITETINYKTTDKYE